MKKTKFIHQSLTKFQNPFGEILNVLSAFNVVFVAKCFSDLYHDFSLPFLYDKVRKNKLANMQHSVASCLPSINLFTAVLCHLIGSILSKTPSKCNKQPLHQRFISGTDRDKSLKVFVPILPIPAVIPDVEGSLSIHDSSHVCGLSDRVFFSNVIRAPRHINPIINVCTLIYNRRDIKCTAAETNPDGTVIGEVIVRASWKHEEVDRNDLLAA